MKRLLLPLAAIISFAASAQNSSADEVLNAEKSFAAYSVEHGTREAFLQFLDSTGVVFENGKVVNGLEAWSRKQARKGVLNWCPVYGAIAKSGELGFTTGPWTFQPKTVKDSIVARGQYTTLWKRSKNGEWKFIIDMGISNTPAFTDAMYQFDEKVISFVPGTWNNLLNKEQKFIRQTADDTSERRRGYESVVSKKAFFLNRNNNLPATTYAGLNSSLLAMPAKIEYTIQGSGISSAGDLGYVYGTTVIKGKADNYLRIWRRERTEWKLCLEVLPY